MAWKEKATGIFCVGAVTVFIAALLLLPGCKNSHTKETASAVTVRVADVIVKDVPVYSEWTASTDGLVNAIIRAQVQGYLIEQDYNECDFVKKGTGSLQN